MGGIVKKIANPVSFLPLPKVLEKVDPLQSYDPTHPVKLFQKMQRRLSPNTNYGDTSNSPTLVSPANNQKLGA